MFSNKMNKKTIILLFLLLILVFILGQKILEALKKEPSSVYSLSHVDKQLEHFIPIYSKAAQSPWPVISLKQDLKLGAVSDSVLLLRKRLQLTGDLSKTVEAGREFDHNLEQAVQHFQQRHGIKTTGQVGPETLTALNISPKIRLKQLQINIERWKKFEHSKDSRYLWVNIPDYHVRLIEGKQVSMKQRVIIGKPNHPTPELFTEMTHVMLNPYWIIPNSIAKTNLIPKAMENPSYLEHQHIHLYEAGTQQEIPVDQINWSLLNDNIQNYFFRQEPGPRNPLGQIKFQITNTHSIYLHDTSSKELFDKSHRALSSGCIRIQNPFILFSKLAEYSEYISKQNSKVNDILKSGETVSIKLKEPLPVYITYLTAWVDKNGLLHFENDVYNRDAA